MCILPIVREGHGGTQDAVRWSFSTKHEFCNMTDPTEQLIMVLDLSANRKVKARVSERVNAGLCLGDAEDGKQCDCAARTRGLCERHHYKWRNRRLRMGATKAAIYDSKLIRAGRLLSPGGAKEYRSKSVYDRLAKEA